jgi:uncharacterized protein involved in outer membrane biogenesis
MALMKRLWRVGVALIVLLVVLFLAARWYLSSRQVADRVAARLQDLLGGRVRVASADVGLADGSFLEGVEVYEPEAEPAAEPWLTAARVDADVSALGLLKGHDLPHRITLTGAAVVLRFDRQGHLLTRLPVHHQKGTPGDLNPANVPGMDVELGQITFKREGEPDFVVRRVNANLAAEGGRLVLTGTAANSLWGEWALGGAFKEGGKEVAVTLQSQGNVHLTQAMLDGLPFVSPLLWQEVRIPEADTAGRIALRYDLPGKAFHYRVELEPRRTRVEVPGIHFQAADAAGKVTVDDAQVVLRGLRGRAYGGTLQADADLDFRAAAIGLHIADIQASGLDVGALPASWKLPRAIRGRLSGKAALDVTFRTTVPPTLPAATVGLIEGGGLGALAAAGDVVRVRPQTQVITRGQGRGVITDATVAGQKAEPITLELRSVPGGFRFGSSADEVQENDETRAPIPLPGPHASPVHGATEGKVVGLATETALVQDPGEAPAAGEVAGELARAATAGMRMTFRRIVTIGRGLAGLMPKDLKPRPRKAGQPAPYLNINFKMNKVDLAQFASGLGLKLPFTLQGRLSFQVQAGIPLESSGDLKTFRAQGSATVTDLVLGELELDKVSASVRYAGGVLNLESLEGTIAGDDKGKPGTFRGSARLPVSPLGDLSADLTVDRIPLDLVAKLAGAQDLLQETLSGTLHAEVPGAQLQKVEAWTAAGKVIVKQARALGWSVRDGMAELRLEKGRLALADVKAQVEGTPVTGAGSVGLAAPFPFQGQVKLREGDLSALQGLAPRWRPPVPVAGRLTTSVEVQGTVRPFTLSTSGTAAAPLLKVSDLTLNDVHFRWDSDASRLTLKDIRANLYSGTATGEAVLPLQAKAAGSVSLHVQDVDVGALVKALPGLPVRAEGRAAGDVKGTLPPAEPGGKRTAHLDLDLKAPRLRVQGVLAEQLHGTLKYQEGVFDYRLEGKSLGGTFEVDGQYPPAPQPPKGELVEGHLRVRGARLAGLLGAFQQRPGRLPIQGSVDLELAFRPAPKRGLAGQGQLVVRDVRWRGKPVGTLRSDVLLRGEELRLGSVKVRLGSGTIRGQLAYFLREPRRSWFTLDLDRVEAADLAGPWLESPEEIQGTVTGQLRGKLGETWFGSADLVLDRGKIHGLEVSEWRLPASWELVPGDSRGTVTVQESSASVARGRVTGRATLRWGYGATVEGQILFRGVDLQTLLRQAGASQAGSGLMSGRFDFSGTDVRSLNDLNGVLSVTLGQTQALQNPVLREISPFHSISPSTSFNQGQLRARLGRGLVRIEQLTLQGSSLRVYVDGTVSLQGRLNLTVIANSGRVGLDPLRLQILGIRLPAVGPIPLTLLVEANDYLSNHTVQLQVTGTLRSPNVRIAPLATLQQEAIRFFLTRYNIPQP